MSERPESDSVEQAHDRAVDALIDWSVAPPGSGHHVHDILDDFEQAIRAEAVKPWREAVREIERVQERAMATLRKHGIKFEDIGNDPTKNWQHVAFTVYTDLCDAANTARALLDGGPEGGE